LKKAIVIHGNGMDQETLPRENIEGVDAFVALTRDDDGSLIVLLLPRRLGAKMLVALVKRRDYLPLAQRLGINTTVSLF
jgi:trk system potassium uptake protein TrkA